MLVGVINEFSQTLLLLGWLILANHSLPSSAKVPPRFITTSNPPGSLTPGSFSFQNVLATIKWIMVMQCGFYGRRVIAGLTVPNVQPVPKDLDRSTLHLSAQGQGR